MTTTTAGQIDYDLPADFLRLLDQSGWNRTSRFPLGGPLTPQEWQYLKAAVVGVTFNVLFRLRTNPTASGASRMAMSLFPTPPAGVSIAFEYQSRYWLFGDAGGGALTETLANENDVVLFEPHLVVRGLVYKFKQARGFDTTAFEAEYQRALDREVGNNVNAQRLSLTGQQVRDRYINGYNLPITGFGGGS